MSDLLGIASSGITAYQRALATVSNNIANVNTEGYSRQGVGQAASAPRLVGTNYLGTGTVFTGVRRQYDSFIEQNLRNSSSELQSQGPMVTYVNRLIDVMGNQSVGLTSAMNQFFESARNLASDPASTVQRSSFLRDAEGLAARFQQLDDQMASLDTETRQSIETDVGKVNSLTRQLAEVNRQMARSATLDRQPAELLDQRDNLLRQLSELTAIKTRYSDNGAVLVSVGDVISQGVLVDGPRSYDIGLAAATDNDPDKIRFVLDPYGTPRSLPNLLSGKIGGAMAFRDSVLAPSRAALDGLAAQMVKEVNTVHRSGIDLQGDVGQDLFTIQPGGHGAAAGITLAITDGNRVAAAGQFRVIDDPLNVGTAQATVAWRAPEYAGDATLSGRLALGQSPALGEELFRIGNGQPFLSVGTIPLGTKDAVLTLQAPQGGQSLRVFTRDGRQLLGPALGPADQGRVLTQANGLEAGATYRDDTAAGPFLGMDLFLGARGAPQQLQQFDPKTGQPVAPLAAPAVLQGAALPANLTGPIEAGTFTLNGQSLGALNQSGPLTADDLADWINGQNGGAGIAGLKATAQAVTRADGSIGQALRIERTDGDTTADIRLGLGASRTPADLARLGMEYAVHLNGAAADDLLVFVANESNTATTVSLSAQFTPGDNDRQQALRARAMEVEFVRDESSGDLYYRITDQATDAELAYRKYDTDARQLSYRGLTVSFSAVSKAGDHFTLDANRDGIGNNEAMLAMSDLETRDTMPGGLTLTESYIEEVNQVANVAQQASIAQKAMDVVYQQAVQARDGVSGVSLDQEAADLVRFQQAYQANAKVMQVANDLFDAILQVR